MATKELNKKDLNKKCPTTAEPIDNASQKKIFKRNLFETIGIILIFIIASCMYCAPALDGKIIYASDNINGTAASHESKVFHEKTGEYTWWNSAMFSGMPNFQIGGGRYWVTNALQPAYKFFYWGLRNAVFIVLFYLVAFFILLRSFGVNRWISLAGAFAIAFSSYFFIIIAAQHHGKCMSITWMTLVLVGMMLIFKKKYAWGSCFVMFFTVMGLTIHPQMAYYIFMLMGIMACAEIYIHIKEKRWKDLGVAFALFGVSLAIGMGVCSGNIFVNQEYAKETMRGGHSELTKNDDKTNKTKGLDLDYATAWSYGIDETMTLMIPNFMGGASGYNVGTESVLYNSLVQQGVPGSSAREFCSQAPTYWGKQMFTSGPVYVGAIVCFLFILGLLIVKGPYKWALLVATLFSILLSWGKNFMPMTEFFFHYFPMYDKFRAVSSILIVAEITIPLLGFLALKAISNKEVDKKKILKSVYISGGITAGICLIFALFGSSFLNFTSPNDAQFQSQFWYNSLIDQRASMLKADAWRSFIFIALAVGLVLLYANEKLKTTWFAVILSVLVVADMWPVNKRFFNDDNFVSVRQRDKAFTIEPYEQQILQDKDPNFRVINLAANTFNDARTSYRLKSIGGYSAAKLRRYQDLIDQHITKMNMSVLNMLNCKYFIVPSQNQNNPSQNQEIMVQRNPNALGNVWFVDTLVKVGNANAESDALKKINPRTTAVVDTTKFGNLAKAFVANTDSTAQIKETSFAPNKLEYVSNSKSDALAVFSEIYYPYGWKVSIDGKPVDHYRVNYVLRALPIPAGQHKIAFVFDPDSVHKGNTLSMICFTIMMLGMLGWAGNGIWQIRKQKIQK